MYGHHQQQQLAAQDVYKTEYLAQQQSQHPAVHYAQQPPPLQPPPPQSVPLSMLEPQDLAQGSTSMLASSGPLAAGAAAGAVAVGGVAAAVGITAAAAATRSKSQRAPSSKNSLASLPAVAVEDEYNDAYLTWIDGQLLQDQKQLAAPRKAPPPPTAAAAPPPTAAAAAAHKYSPSRSRFDDVSAYEISFDSLNMGRLVGEGSFGKVYLATWNETPVAVKVLVDATSALDTKVNDPMRLRRMAEPVLDKLSDEAGLMASMRHPNIIQFMGIVSMPPCVVTEYCERGSMADVLKRGRKGEPGAVEALGWRLRLGMAADAATGMLYLHARSPPIIHRDLKSPNLLVDSHWRVKVCDFNMSRIMEESGQGSSLAGTNPRWLAPELLTGESATHSSDVFAFGVTMWELMTWELPWMKDNPWSVAHTVGNGGRLPIPNRWDLPGLDTNAFTRLDDYIALMQRCWAQNPYDRPRFSEIIQELRSMENSMPVQEMRKTPSSATLSSLGVGTTGTTTTTAPPPPPPSVSSTGGPASIAPPTSEALADELYEDLASASISSATAVAASYDHTGSMAQWDSRMGWGSKPPR